LYEKSERSTAPAGGSAAFDDPPQPLTASPIAVTATAMQTRCLRPIIAQRV
jgi:hypothetical protein